MGRLYPKSEIWSRVFNSSFHMASKVSYFSSGTQITQITQIFADKRLKIFVLGEERSASEVKIADRVFYLTNADFWVIISLSFPVASATIAILRKGEVMLWTVVVTYNSAP